MTEIPNWHITGDCLPFFRELTAGRSVGRFGPVEDLVHVNGHALEQPRFRDIKMRQIQRDAL